MRSEQGAGDVATDWHPRVEFIIKAIDIAQQMKAPEFIFAGGA
jgi:hypothetical protein